jgi:putative transposase
MDQFSGRRSIMKYRGGLMKARKYTEEQIIAVLREAEAGTKVADLCRKYGMSDATYYNWKVKYAGLTVSELKRLKALEEENRRLKQIVAEQALDNRALKELLSKNF